MHDATLSLLRQHAAGVQIMRLRIRLSVLRTLVAAAVALLWLSTGGEVAAAGRHVVIKDTEALSPQAGFDPRQGRWQFTPTNIEVTRGEPVVFDSPPSNIDPHTVTSLTRVGSPFAVPVQFVVGTFFDSSRTAAALIQPGESFTLDTTSTLVPGNYAYVCKLHPWMNGEITVK
jgi:plastocyanin